MTSEAFQVPVASAEEPSADATRENAFAVAESAAETREEEEEAAKVQRLLDSQKTKGGDSAFATVPSSTSSSSSAVVSIPPPEESPVESPSASVPLSLLEPHPLPPLVPPSPTDIEAVDLSSPPAPSISCSNQPPLAEKQIEPETPQQVLANPSVAEIVPKEESPLTKADENETEIEAKNALEEPSKVESSPTAPRKELTRRVFQCSTCHTYYEDWNLFLHMRNVHSRFICLLCLGLFPNAKRLARHLINRHALPDNHFQSTSEMLVWNENRPCHMMCVACEEVEEFRPDSIAAGQTAKEHNCGQGASGGKQSAEHQTEEACKSCGALGAHLCTTPGGGKCGKANKKRHHQRKESNSALLSSNLVTESPEGGFKLKIKGLMGVSNHVKAVNQGRDEERGKVNDSVDGGGSDNRMELEGNQQVDDDQRMEVDGGGGQSVEDGGDAERSNPGTEIGVGVAKSSFNFILSKNGLIRNPNPTKKRVSSQDGGEHQQRHSESNDEERTSRSDVKQEENIEGQSEIREIKREGDGEVVPPLLVSKLKLKIPKYIVPVESDESDEDEEEDYDEDDEKEVEDEDEEEGELRLKRISDGNGDASSTVVKKEPGQVDEEGANANDKSHGTEGGESSKEKEADVKLEDGDGREKENQKDRNEKEPSDEAGGGLSISLFDSPEKKVKDPSDPFADDERDGDKLDGDEDEDKKPELLIDADGLLIADSNSQSFELSLNQPLDHIPVKEFLRTCLRATIPFCLYCYHARRIAVNGKQLAVHMISTHRFTALVDSITAEELMPETIVARLKGCLDELEPVFFNLDEYDSEVKAPLKMKAKIFECFQCRFTTGTHKELYLHNRKLHLKTVLLCLMCRSTFYNYSELLCHICPGVASRDLNYDLLFRCYYCNVNDLPSAFRLMVHLRKSHAVCEVCLEECFDQTRLSNHAWKHKLHHFCYRCGIAYRNKQDITRHLFWKHGTESELCKKCLQKRWPHIFHFCLPPMQFNCDQCVLTFTKAVHLRVHKRLHTEECPYGCPEENCDQKFISRRMLEKHERVHLGLPPEEGEQQQQQVMEQDVAEAEGNANGMNVVKEEIIGGAEDADGGDSKASDPIMDMPVPNLSESDSSDDSDEEGGGGRRGSGRGGALFEGVKMSRLSDSSDNDSDEEEEESSKDGDENKKKKEILEGDSSVTAVKEEKMVVSLDARKSAADDNNSRDAFVEDAKGELSDGTTSAAAVTESLSIKIEKPPVDPQMISQQVAEKATEEPDSDDEDGERTKTKAIIDIWENFRSYQATQIQQQRQSDDEEEDLIAPLPPPILHVLQSDHDYALMYKVYSRIDDDQDLKEIQDIEMMRRSGKLFKSSLDTDSASSCSCGTNCSCSSSNSSSSSSSSDSSSSSSSSSSSEDESKMTKKQRQIRAQRKAKRRARKLKKNQLANGKDGAGGGAENDNLLLTINDEVVTRLPETDLETDESETDEEFYDANPYKIAQQRLAEKNKLDEEEAEEKRSRKERRRRHRRAKRLEKLKELEEITGAALESRLEAAAAAACPEASQSLINKLNSSSSRATTPQNVVPPLRLNFAARMKKEQDIVSPGGSNAMGGKVNGGKQSSSSRSSPVTGDSYRGLTIPPQQSLFNSHSLGTEFGKFAGPNSSGFGSGAGGSTLGGLVAGPAAAAVSGNNSSAAVSVNDEDSSSSSSNVKRSKRRRIPNRFYGYSSDDESMAVQAGLTNAGAGGLGPGGMFRPQPPPNLTWNKEDLPSSTTGNHSTNHAHSRMSVDSKIESLELVLKDGPMMAMMKRGGEAIVSGGGVMRPKKRARSSLNEDERRLEDGFDLDDALLVEQMRANKRKKMRLLMNDDVDDDALIPYGRTPKNSFSGVFSAASPGQQQQQRRQRGQEEEAEAGKRGHHPQLAAQLQSAVRVVRPEPLPRLKIRTNGVAMMATTTTTAVAATAAGAGGADAEPADLYCYCRGPYVGEMIGCDGEGCRIEWFHFECVGILMAPQGKWYCPDCRQKRRGIMTNGQPSFSMTTMDHV